MPTRLLLATTIVLTLAACAATPPTTPTTPATASAIPEPSLLVTPVPGVPAGALPGFVPRAIAFADADHGWVAGSTGGDAAFVLETADGARTWSPHQVGTWVATAVAAAPGGPWVSTPCPEDEPDCSPALVHADAAGVWQPTAGVAPLSIAFAGDTGVLAVVLRGGPRHGSGLPIPAVRVTNDGGKTWEQAINPCGTLDLEDLAAASPTELLVLCGGQGAGGGQRKALFASADLGASWEARASTDDGLPLPGTKIGFDVASDGTGFWWGPGTPAMATSDGGRTWRALDVADGEGHMAGAGAALRSGSGYLLVDDGNASVLLWTADGATWDERAAWPDPPCCGG